VLFTNRGGPYCAVGDAFPKLFAPLRVGPLDCDGSAFHTFRKTVAKSLTDEGVPRVIVDRILGWAPEGMLGSFYYAATPEDLHTAIRKLYGGEAI
jgi:hypothetical protein